jgi:hypothetical protein
MTLFLRIEIVLTLSFLVYIVLSSTFMDASIEC